MNEERLAEIEARHMKFTGVRGAETCVHCPEWWPCDAQKLVSEVRRLTLDAAWVKAAVTANRDVCDPCASEIARAVGWPANGD